MIDLVSVFKQQPEFDEVFAIDENGTGKKSIIKVKASYNKFYQGEMQYNDIQCASTRSDRNS